MASDDTELAKQSQNPVANINKFTFQPIITYNLDDGWYLSATTTMTANWEASSGDE